MADDYKARGVPEGVAVRGGASVVRHRHGVCVRGFTKCVQGGNNMPTIAEILAGVNVPAAVPETKSINEEANMAASKKNTKPNTPAPIVGANARLTTLCPLIKVGNMEELIAALGNLVALNGKDKVLDAFIEICDPQQQ